MGYVLHFGIQRREKTASQMWHSLRFSKSSVSSYCKRTVPNCKMTLQKCVYQDVTVLFLPLNIQDWNITIIVCYRIKIILQFNCYVRFLFEFSINAIPPPSVLPF